MLTAAAHELRGPLGVARGYLRLLVRQVGDGGPARKAVDEASPMPPIAWPRSWRSERLRAARGR
ncbi:MAG: hypothetical protein R2712_11410 [Vicinamibacterales bacterium]